MINNLLFTVFFLAGMVGLVVSVIILCKKENSAQNTFLSLCLFVLSCGCIYALYSRTGNVSYYPKIVLALKSCTYLVAPCAYLYTKKLLNPAQKFKWHYCLHFIPLVISIVYTMATTKRFVDVDFWTINNLFFNIDFYTFNMVVNLIWLLYAYTQILMILTYKNNMAFLSAEKITWLKAFSSVMMLLFISLFIQKISAFTFEINFNIINNTIITVILLGSGYIVFFRPSVFFEVSEPEVSPFISAIITDPSELISDCTEKLQADCLSKEKIESYTLAIDEALADKPFLQKGFVIRDLSALTNIPVHHLSHFINSHHNLHFQDFINKKRIEYLLEQREDKEWKSLSLEGQAWAVGFKSRTTFFRAFTKLMGKSPSEYVNAINKAASNDYSATA